MTRNVSLLHALAAMADGLAVKTARRAERPPQWWEEDVGRDRQAHLRRQTEQLKDEAARLRIRASS